MRNRWQEMTVAKSFVGVYSSRSRRLVPDYGGSRFSYEILIFGTVLLLESKSKAVEIKGGNVNRCDFNAIEG
jgi:hypothetical protein